ncbi:hypothetical protein EYC84_012038 [Monilinia fructicola]|uniref:Amino acid permease/ SLC12A domain-containing protein n=1 Tax=Monilinia fructicola TaxID=38448 RepID=A0A5M9J4B5_MONFR|nr:hypothetical protein EYC84_012038 [Monilinia fructicola]
MSDPQPQPQSHSHSHSLFHSKSPIHVINPDDKDTEYGIPPSDLPNDGPPILADKLARSLSARQVQMIAIGGTIGTGLFLGTGKSLATGGPASILIAYFIHGGGFGRAAAGLGVLGDLGLPGWGLALIFWVFLIAANIITVKAYGELEYWLSLLKVVTVTIFIILGIAVNCGGNTSHTYLGAHYWYIGDAPFVGGIGGFASVFVTASFAYGGTESIAITAGETKNPTKNLPRVVKNVFWRILIFYILSVLLIGLNVPYNYPNLSSKKTATSPFTIIFQMAGAKAAGSFINAVILTSVISAGNHALFAGTRLLYTLSVAGHAPHFLGKLNRNRVPWVAVLATSAISGLCFGASFIGAGQLWSWLQNLVGVSNQIAWISIGVTSIRFRGALERQGKTHLLPFRNWTYPWGPWLCVLLNVLIVLVQGWSSFSPRFSAVDFVSYYIELPIMAVMWLGWKWLKGTKVVSYEDMDLVTDVHVIDEADLKEREREKTARGKAEAILRWIF